jgi:hypothetical protein
MDRQWWAARVTNSRRLFSIAKEKIFLWLCTIGCVIALPCLPIPLEYMRTGKVSQDTLLIICVIISATYGLTAGSWFYKFFYWSIFAISCIFDVTPETSPVVNIAHHGWSLLAGLAALQAAERFNWHVFQDRPFPDVEKKGSH